MIGCQNNLVRKRVSSYRRIHTWLWWSVHIWLAIITIKEDGLIFLIFFKFPETSMKVSSYVSFKALVNFTAEIFIFCPEGIYKKKRNVWNYISQYLTNTVREKRELRHTSKYCFIHLRGYCTPGPYFSRLCAFSQKIKQLDRESYGSGQKCSKELKNHSFTSVETIVVKLQ